MRILFATEGTYPSIMGGVSTWCDQLVRGLSKHEFHVLQVTGPVPAKPAYALPTNVVKVTSLPLWKPRRGTRPSRATRKAVRAGFQAGLEHLLLFSQDDLAGFRTGLTSLSRLGTHVDLWPYFQDPAVWQHVREVMHVLRGEAPTVAEVGLAVTWLRGTLVPLLHLPPPADQAHTTSNGLSAIPAWLAAQEYGIPLMLTEHGLYLRERYLSLSSDENPPALKLLRARFYRAIAQLIYADADLIVSVSEFNRAWQIQLGAPVERTRVVYNGVAPSAFPAASDAPQADPTVAWVGRVDPIKDLATLITSFHDVAAHAPKARLRLFGPVPKGNERYRTELDALVRGLHLGAHVSFEGPISPIHHAYHAADLLALSSVSEGFPYVAIEAMMCGRPVVATRVGGVGEAVGAFGRMVAPRNATQMGAALSELLDDVPLRKQLGAGARERALSLFTLDRMYKGYRHLYGELSNRSSVAAAR